MGKVEITEVHRTDDRDIDDLKKRGFDCQNGMWSVRNAVFAKMFIAKLLDSKHDASKLPAFAQEVLAPTPIIFKKNEFQEKTLLDVMAFIKRVTKDTRAFWVSTSVNNKVGGQDKKHLYKVKLPVPLKQYEITGTGPVKTLKALDDRTDPLTPSLCLDNPSFNNAKIIAINSGPLNDVEISFLTTIQFSWIEKLS
jgi:hypothetical protein